MRTIPIPTLYRLSRVLVAGVLLAGCSTDSGSGNRAVPGSQTPQVLASNYDPCQANLDAELPIITCQPVDLTNALGTRAIFSVMARGNGALTYQWYHGGATSSEFVAMPGENQRRLIIPTVTKADYGAYFCVIASEGTADEWPVVTQTRMAELGGRPSDGAGGTFAAMQYPAANSTTTSICGQTVSGRWVKFSGSQTPDPGMTRWQGKLLNITSNSVVINHNDYLLQIWVTSADTSCCTVVADNTTAIPPIVNEVAYTPVTSMKSYRFIAHFKVGKAPPVGNVIELRGDWKP